MAKRKPKPEYIVRVVRIEERPDPMQQEGRTMFTELPAFEQRTRDQDVVKKISALMNK